MWFCWCVQFIYMLLHCSICHAYWWSVCKRWLYLTWWSNLSNKAKKIEIVMNRIKNTKRLTFNNFPAKSEHPLDRKKIQETNRNDSRNLWLAIICVSVWVVVPSSKNTFEIYISLVIFCRCELLQMKVISVIAFDALKFESLV